LLSDGNAFSYIPTSPIGKVEGVILLHFTDKEDIVDGAKAGVSGISYFR